MTRPRGTGSLMDGLDRRRLQFDDLYFGRRLALRPVAEAMDVSVKTLTLWAQSRGIKLRDKKQAHRIRSKRIGKADQVLYLRLIRKLTIGEIERRLGYRSKGGVHNILACRGVSGELDEIPAETMKRWRRYFRSWEEADSAQTPPSGV